MMYGNSSKEDFGLDGLDVWYGGLRIRTAGFRVLESRNCVEIVVSVDREYSTEETRSGGGLERMPRKGLIVVNLIRVLVESDQRCCRRNARLLKVACFLLPPHFVG